MDAFFLPEGPDRFRATQLTAGPWDPAAQHAGPPSALLGSALERCGDRGGMQMVRVSVEILRPVPIGVLQVAAEVVRPGRSVEMLAGTLTADGVDVMHATAWRIRTEDIGVEVVDDTGVAPLPDGSAAQGPSPWSAEIGYHTAMEWRFTRGSFLEPGPATVWMRMRHPLVAGEQPSPLSRVLAAADSGNGVSAVLDFARFLFVNTDLTVSLHRHPAGEWVCLDAATTIQPNGIGLAQTRLFDERGPLGRGTQSLYVARR